MRLLAIDTSLEACSVGVADGAAPPLIVSEVIGRGHAERLFGMLQQAMAEAGLAFADLDRIAVTVGPGSFTGLRVGIATARGLALAIERPAIGIGTLAVHAETARTMAGSRPILAVLDARRGEVYGQTFDSAGAALAEPEVGTAANLAERLEPDMAIAGWGADLVAAALPALAGAEIVHRNSAPDVAALIRLGLAAPPPDHAPRPLYLRPPDARPQAAAGIARL